MLTRNELEQMRATRIEILNLQDELDNMPIAKDSVRGSMAEFPYIEMTIPIEGTDIECAVELINKKEARLKQRQKELLEMENWISNIPDSEARVIFEEYYKNGLTHEEIGKKIGYARTTITMKIERFLKKYKL